MNSFSQMSPQQQAMMKNLLLLGALYFGAKLTSKAARYGIFGYVAYSIYQMNKQGAHSSMGNPGWQMKVDPGLAVDLLFPSMKSQDKVFARMAADHVLGAILSPVGVQRGRI